MKIARKSLIATLVVGSLWSSAPASSQPVVNQTPTVRSTTPDTSRFVILDLGATPRQQLKFQPVVNSKQTVTMTMGMSMEMMMGKYPIPKTVIPKVAMKIDAVVSEIEPSGDIHYSFAYRQIQVIPDKTTSPELTATLQKSFSQLGDLKGNIVISKVGRVKNLAYVFPQKLDPSMKRTLEQYTKSIENISTTLPLMSVGLGAKWRTEDNLQISGIQLTQTATYEIVELTERGMKLRSKVTQFAPAQKLKLPEVQSSGAIAQIQSLNSKGDGLIDVAFDSVLPTAGKLSIATDSDMSVQMGSKDPATKITSKIAIDLDLSAR